MTTSVAALDVTAATGQVIGELQIALVSENAARVGVSLDALAQFSQQLRSIHARIGAAIARSGEVTSLERSLVRLRRLVERNLDALYQAYSACLATDAAGAAQPGALGEGLTSATFGAR